LDGTFFGGLHNEISAEFTYDNWFNQLIANRISILAAC
jgi:hypothetical protein